MSGGVDSSVAACLLVEQGFDVLGLFMRVGVSEGGTERHGHEATATVVSRESRNPVPSELPASSTGGMHGRRPHQGCCSANDAADARFVAGMLGIPFYALNFEKDFDRLIDYFADEYASGRTPNPCVMCNNELKFGRVVEYADAVGARYIATGHYARVASGSSLGIHRQNAGATSVHATDLIELGSSSRATEGGGNCLLRGRDGRKDQSYVLFGLDRTILDRAMFPIGHLTKTEVRAIAARFGLPNQNKPDSVEICFVPDRDYARVVRQRRPEAFQEGRVVDENGRELGIHPGVGHFTIGQRRGLGIALGEPHYVTALNVAANSVTLGPAESLLSGGLVGRRANFLTDAPGDSFRAEVKIRYLHSAVPATVYREGPSDVRVRFDDPQRAVTPGQAVVFYDGDLVLGGAWIESAVSDRDGNST